MKPSLYFLSVIILFSFAACKRAPLSDEAMVSEPKQVKEDTTGELFKVDLLQSKIEWIGTKITGYHTGTVQIKNGDMQVKNGKIIGGRFTIDMNTIVVLGPKSVSQEDCNKLQKHLKSADFFEVSAYPEVIFELTRIKPYVGLLPEEENDPHQQEISEYKVTAPTHIIGGNLTIKGITKNIEFPASIKVTPSFVEGIAKFNIDRTLWNITYPGKPDDLIRKEIYLGISFITKDQPDS